MNSALRAAFDDELAGAEQLIAAGQLDAAFAHLETAHVLGQAFVLPHARSHWLMCRVEIRRGRPAAVVGQIVRILLGTVGSAIGIVPVGNTGGTDISMFKRLPVRPELQTIIDASPSTGPED
jgi:hypothetical protein